MRDIGDARAYYIPVMKDGITPGIYYWKDTQENVFKALLIIDKYVIGIKQ
jgi:hypothetical protein